MMLNMAGIDRILNQFNLPPSHFGQGNLGQKRMAAMAYFTGGTFSTDQEDDDEVE